MPRAPLPSEAAAESDGHGVPCCSQAAQALHSGLEASAGPSHPAGQHASHEAPPPPESESEEDGHGVPCSLQAAQALHSGLEASAEVSQIPVGQHASHEGAAETESRPLESIDSPLAWRYMLQAEADVMQVPESPVQISQPSPVDNPVWSVAQLVALQAESIVTVSPAQTWHEHVVPESPEDPAPAERQGGHSCVAAQQPLLPGLEPSAHVAAEAPAAKTSTSTHAVSLPTKAMIERSEHETRSYDRSPSRSSRSRVRERDATKPRPAYCAPYGTGRAVERATTKSRQWEVSK